MRSLRRDLFERRLWPIVVLLVIAVIAVPVLLTQSRSSPISEPLASLPSSGATVTDSIPKVGHRAGTDQVQPNTTRNPFAGGSSGSSPKSGSDIATSTIDSNSASQSTGSASSTAAVTTAPEVTGGASSHGIATSHTAGASAHSNQLGDSPSPVNFSVKAKKSTPTATKVSQPHSAKIQSPSLRTHVTGKASAALTSWTIRGADVSLGESGKTIGLRDLARLMPLPSSSQPEVMFEGVTAHGEWAVFQVALGVEVNGPAWCRPSVKMCTSLMLPVHGVEALTYTPSGGQATTFQLRLDRVTATRTHSAKAAAAAAKRESTAGACELELAGATHFDPSTLATNAPTPARSCLRDHQLVPFLGIGG